MGRAVMERHRLRCLECRLTTQSEAEAAAHQRATGHRLVVWPLVAEEEGRDEMPGMR